MVHNSLPFFSSPQSIFFSSQARLGALSIIDPTAVLWCFWFFFKNPFRAAFFWWFCCLRYDASPPPRPTHPTAVFYDLEFPSCWLGFLRGPGGRQNPAVPPPSRFFFFVDPTFSPQDFSVPKNCCTPPQQRASLEFFPPSCLMVDRIGAIPSAFTSPLENSFHLTLPFFTV